MGENIMKKMGLKLTDKDRKAIAEEIERNRQQRLEFVDFYANWLKKTPNKVWSKQYVKYFGK